VIACCSRVVRRESECYAGALRGVPVLTGGAGREWFGQLKLCMCRVLADHAMFLSDHSLEHDSN
jgi:hypothetical protein